MKLSESDIKRLEELLDKLSKMMQENGFDDTPEELFESSVIDRLQNEIDEFN